MRRRSEIVPRPWATSASAIRPVSGQRINCLGDLYWPRWEGPEQGSRNCVGGAAERQLRRPQGRQRARQSPPASLPFEQGRENPWGSGRTGAWSQRRLPEISRSSRRCAYSLPRVHVDAELIIDIVLVA